MKFLATLALAMLFPILVFADARAHLSLEGRSFPYTQPDPVQPYEGILEGEYENRFPLSDTLSIKFHPFFQVSSLPEAFAPSQEKGIGDGNPYLLDPRELYAAYESNNYYLQAGYFTLVYEGTDGINPMDIASMKYWGDPVNSITRGSAGFHFGYAGNKFEVEAAYIPEQTRSILPGETSPWLPRHSRFPLRTSNIELRLPDRVDYEYSQRSVLNHAFEHNYTARVQLRTDLGDAAVAFFEGASAAPMIVPELNVTPISFNPDIYLLNSPVQLIPRYYRRRTVSGIVTKPFGEWIVRVASRYDQPLKDAKVFTTWSGQTVGGVEKSFIVFNESLTVILQGSLVQSPKDQSLISIQDLFDKAVLLGVRWPVNDYWTLQLSGLRSGKDQSSLYTAQVSREFLQNWTAKGEVELVEGPPKSVLGLFDHNDRATLMITRSF